MKQVAVAIKVAPPRALLRRLQAELNQQKANARLQHREGGRSRMRSRLGRRQRPCTIDCSTYRQALPRICKKDARTSCFRLRHNPSLSILLDVTPAQR